MKRMGGENLRYALAWMCRHFLVPLYLLLLASQAWGEEDEIRFLELFNGSAVETVSIGRSPRPASQTAENITVVTAREIEALNAHTLVDALFLVTGVELEQNRTPGTISSINLQGSNFNHILVLIDDVPINNLADNFPDISSIPVQMIERIEIVKGAASSSWGNALGGVVNIITKTPQTNRPFNGLISASGGKASTIDGRGEATGTVNSVGYYLTGGKLRSDGLLPNNMADLNHFYGKLHYDLPSKGSFSLTTFLTDSSTGQTQHPPRDINLNQDVTQLIGTLSAQVPLTERLTMEAMFRTRQMESDILYTSIMDRSLLRDVKNEESSNGGVLSLSYFDELQRVIAGVDYDHLKVHLSQPQHQVDVLKRSDDRVGVYLNDTFTLGRLAITPSARFDHTETNGNLFSPSGGITYAVTDNSVLRFYTAKGYSITSLNQTNSLEKVWTSQVGFESADVPYLWLKGTFFRNETSDITVQNPDGSLSKQRQLKRGAEFEARTLPVGFTSFSLGYSYIDGRDDKTGTVAKGIPRHTLNLGIKYEDDQHWRALLTGRYIDWNADPQTGAKYHGVSTFATNPWLAIWDLHLAKKLEYSDTVAVEFFASIRNLFDVDQYTSPYYSNPGRWWEVGIRCAF